MAKMFHLLAHSASHDLVSGGSNQQQLSLDPKFGTKEEQISQKRTRILNGSAIYIGRRYLDTSDICFHNLLVIA